MKEKWELKNLKQRREQFELDEKKRMENANPEEKKQNRLQIALKLKETWKLRWKDWRNGYANN